jgi:hypothetical protein
MDTSQADGVVGDTCRYLQVIIGCPFLAASYAAGGSPIKQGKGMNTYNPYEAPKADISAPLVDEAGIELVASAQKLIIYSILAYFAAAAVRAFLGPVGLLVALAALLMGLIGTYRLCVGLGFSMTSRVVLMVLMFVPLVSLIVLLVLNAKATGKLRAAGYRVGLLGASR